MASVGSQQIVGDGTSLHDWASWRGFQAMQPLSLDDLVPAEGRAIIVAPHLDDEVLGCGGLMQALHSRGRRMMLVAVTDGGDSQPRSTARPDPRLLEARPRESLEAWRALGLNEPLSRRLGIPDGSVTRHETRLLKDLLALIEPGDTLFATWEYDGHPDHEATGRAARRACELTGARCVQVPVWTWHWAVPGDTRVPWARARRFELDDKALSRKRQAMAAFESQAHPNPSTIAPPIQSHDAPERLFNTWEVYLV
ncbi:PIG-L deacetylase family protein [Pseudomonas sp. Marseille-QA0892]